jgi:hypothetical protein
VGEPDEPRLAGSHEELTLGQMIAALYRLGQGLLTLKAGSGLFVRKREVGLSGYDCANCSDEDKRERGACPFLLGAGPGENPTQIDSTGDEARDFVRVCPRALEIREPALAATVSRFDVLEACGGPGQGWSGVPLGQQPSRVSWSWSMLRAVQSRWQAEVQRARRDVDAEALQALRRQSPGVPRA